MCTPRNRLIFPLKKPTDVQFEQWIKKKRLSLTKKRKPETEKKKSVLASENDVEDVGFISDEVGQIGLKGGIIPSTLSVFFPLFFSTP